MQAQLQTSPVPPVQQPPNVGTQVVVQSKEKDPNVLYEQFRKRGATKFYGTKNVMKADEWLEHIEDVFGIIVCTHRQRVLLAFSMLWEVATIWETFKKQSQRKFIPEHVQQQKEEEFLNLKQGQMTVSAYVHIFFRLFKYATDLVVTEAKKVKRFIAGLNPKYKTIVLVGQKPTSFDDAIDGVFTAEKYTKRK